MIRDNLEPALRDCYPDIPFTFAVGSKPFARASCPCAELGDLEIYDDGNEATVALTKIFHSHFRPQPKMSAAARDAWVANAVLEFLDALVTDRVLLYCLPDRRKVGSEIHEEPIDRSKPVPYTKQYECFVWSGPVAREL